MVVLRGVNHSLLPLHTMQYSVACPFRKQVLRMLENLNFLYLLLFKAMPVYMYIAFLVSVIGVTIFCILDSILKFSGKKYSFALHFVVRETGTCPSNDADPSDTDS
jgi:hypothetical protein